MPSWAATDVASELANRETTSLSGVPASSFALTARVSAATAGGSVTVVDAVAELADERAASVSPSCALNSAPSIPAVAVVVASAPECAPADGCGLMVAMAFRVSPPLLFWSIGSGRPRTERWAG
jgi:hypothetical protein